jgi:uncharacterized RDD family membrane protein YckC
MQCKDCGFLNGEDDHRCLRCGRRLRGKVIAAPPGYSGANALAPATLNDTLNDTLTDTLQGGTREFSPLTAASSTQPPLFAGLSQKVIPFDQVRRTVNARTVPPPPIEEPAAPKRTPAKRTAARKPAGAPIEQASLDFIPAAPARARRLKTDVDAQVFCDLPVATPMHRFIASSIDAAVILIGFGVLVGMVETFGGGLGQGRTFWMTLGGSLALVSLFYGLIWAIAGRETAGMRATDLQLITFDGFPLDARSRTLRFASAWLSFGSGGLGIVWALADEENLTWHDHISKTFPTVREVPRTFVKR